jgi:hypothetical protein
MSVNIALEAVTPICPSCLYTLPYPDDIRQAPTDIYEITCPHCQWHGQIICYRRTFHHDDKLPKVR